jgi:hypothetical protein
MDYKYILKVFIFVILILSIIIFINSIGLNLNYKEPKKLLQVVTMEGLEKMENMKNMDTSIILPSSKSDSFCETQRGSSGALDKSCGNLTQKNCNTTSCCVWTSDSKCNAGNIQGPTFNSDFNGKTKKLDYYYFQNNCYGDKCNDV